MFKIFFPVLGVGFSELRQIALTFCHSIVNCLQKQNLACNCFDRRSFAHDTARDLRFWNGYERQEYHRSLPSSSYH